MDVSSTKVVSAFKSNAVWIGFGMKDDPLYRKLILYIAGKKKEGSGEKGGSGACPLFG